MPIEHNMSIRVNGSNLICWNYFPTHKWDGRLGVKFWLDSLRNYLSNYPDLSLVVFSREYFSRLLLPFKNVKMSNIIDGRPYIFFAYSVIGFAVFNKNVLKNLDKNLFSFCLFPYLSFFIISSRFWVKHLLWANSFWNASNYFSAACPKIFVQNIYERKPLHCLEGVHKMLFLQIQYSRALKIPANLTINFSNSYSTAYNEHI